MGPEFSQSYLYQGQHGRVMGEFWRGSAALAAALDLHGRPGDRMRSVAAQAADRITRQQARWADPFGHLLRAGIEHQRGNSARANFELRVAIAGFVAAEMHMWASAARWQLAVVTGDELRQMGQEQLMRGQGVRVPWRIAQTMVPGFGQPRR